MTNPAAALSGRRHPGVFALGCLAVTVGAALHLPMFWMGRDDGYRLADMPMDPGMEFGMFLIFAGIVVAAYGLLPRRMPGADAIKTVHVTLPDDAPLSWAHWRLLGALTLALVIDVMKSSSLGFVLPGVMNEYHISNATAFWLPFSALCGTVVGSVVWGWFADLFGRRASILLAAVMFIGTSICGAMPTFLSNIGMCFLMGSAVGGMLPVAYALLAETMPTRHRGWALVLVGGLGAVGGYLATSWVSSWLQPIFSWRAMWLMNLPTGLVLLLLNGEFPESPKFLLAAGRYDEAVNVLRKFGSLVRVDAARPSAPAPAAAATRPISQRLFIARTVALSVAALAYGLINFGLLIWLPASLVAKGYGIGATSALLAKSALLALPTIFLVAFAYSRWSTKGALVGSIVLAAVGVVGVLRLELAPADNIIDPVLPVAMLIVGVNGLISVLLPYAAESYPVGIRARGTGWIAACSKGGGLIAQALGLLALIPSLGVASVAILATLLVATVLVLRFCSETRGRDLRVLDAMSPGIIDPSLKAE